MSDRVDSSSGPCGAGPTNAFRESASNRPSARAGKIRPAILMWALGVPIPIILIIFLIRGCM